MIMLLAWETRTHLRHLWCLAKPNKAVKPTIKDLSKAPTKAPFVQIDKAVDKYLEKASTIMTALTSKDTQLALVKQFAELLAVDHELKIDEDENGKAENGINADEDELDDASVRPSTPKGRKRKALNGPGTATPKRRRSSALNTPRGGGGRGGKKRSRSRSRAGSSVSADGDDGGGWI